MRIASLSWAVCGHALSFVWGKHKPKPRPKLFDWSWRQITAPGELLACLRALVLEDGWPLERALPLFTSNPAARLKLARKGRVSHSRPPGMAG